MKKHNKGQRPQSKNRRKPQAGSLTPAVGAREVRLSPRAVAGTTLVRASSVSVRHARTQATSVAARDDRFALALLLLPFLIVALSLGAERSTRQLLAGSPAIVTAAREFGRTLTPAPVAERPERVAAIDLSRVPAPLPSPSMIVEPPALPLPSLALIVEPPALPLPSLALIVEPPALPLPSLALIVEPPALPLPSLALMEKPSAAPPICTAKPGLFDPRSTTLAALPQSGGAAAFGFAVAEAAKAQLNEFVIYNAKYQRISYPMGDVAPLFGVCSDIVVRAYRAVGLDLQALIQETRSGRGDRNIDHRRVDVIRKVLGRHGETLAITDLAEDYQPGDIVTYYRPQNRSSTAHIAIVTDLLAPSGRPMIVHNRGWGPQLEDALFVDKITGHYRFTGLKPPPSKGKPSVLARQQSEP